MTAALTKEVGSKFPVKITTVKGEEMVRYIRGFADQQTNIVLISETSYSLALKILEVKEIQKLEFAEGGGGTWKVLYAKWTGKPTKPFMLYFGLISLFLQVSINS